METKLWRILAGLLMLTSFSGFSNRCQAEEIVLDGVLSEGSGMKTKSHTSHFNRERLVEGTGCPSSGWLRSRNVNNRITGGYRRELHTRTMEQEEPLGLLGVVGMVLNA